MWIASNNLAFRTRLIAFAFAPIFVFILAQFLRSLGLTGPFSTINPFNSTQVMSAPSLPTNEEAWRAALSSLPSAEANNGKIPAFFFAHGSPMLLRKTGSDGRFANMKNQAKGGQLSRFLALFGPALLEKYKPKGIVVFSAHWEEMNEVLVTNYDENPLLMDYYGFEQSMYRVKFKSRGDSALSTRIVAAINDAGLKARTLGTMERRGEDGRSGAPGTGLDHGVFIPFKLMFGDEFTSVPIVEVSQDQSLLPDKNWAIGKAVEVLRRVKLIADPLYAFNQPSTRSEGYLILSGGLTVHTFRDWSAWDELTAQPPYRALHNSLIDALQVEDPKDRRAALTALTKHVGFRLAHPREEHFTPIYIAAGAGENGKARLLDATYGKVTVAFGIES